MWHDACFFFRGLMTYSPKSKIPGVCYIIKFRGVKNGWDLPDLAYGLCYKGNTKFGIMELNNVVE